jgi:uncharacterized protein with HEPN domain
MNDVIKKSLTDILMGIEGIEYHLESKRDFSWYQSNRTVKRAVERELEIIGEAVGRILKQDKDFPLSHAKQIISFRNRVIHAYDAVDDNLVWKIIIKDIPILRDEIVKMI